jgi:hypothetical protein
VFFDVANQSYLPAIVERDQLAEGNAKLQVSRRDLQPRLVRGCPRRDRPARRRRDPLPRRLGHGPRGRPDGLHHQPGQLPPGGLSAQDAGPHGCDHAVVVWGAIPIGSIVSGSLGSTIGLHDTIWVGAIMFFFGDLPPPVAGAGPAGSCQPRSTMKRLPRPPDGRSQPEPLESDRPAAGSFKTVSIGGSYRRRHESTPSRRQCLRRSPLKRESGSLTRGGHGVEEEPCVGKTVGPFSATHTWGANFTEIGRRGTSVGCAARLRARRDL